MKKGTLRVSAHYRLTQGVTRLRLPNGLTLLVRENHTAPVVALFALVKIGYFHEPDRLNGISHVIEHMMFKGTPRRPGNEQIARDVRALGGSINAGTYYEETSYYLTVPSQNLEGALDIQADLMRRSLIDAGELAKEIEVIVQESLQKRDNPSAMLLETLYEMAHDLHRIRRWRIGHPETLRAFTREDLVGFLRNTYVPSNITLAVVGDVDTEEVRALVSRFWGDMEARELHREASPHEPPREEFRYRRMTGDLRQRLFAFGFPAPPTLHEDAAPLTVLSNLLSDGRSARLFRRLREDLRVVNSVWASYEGFEERGLFLLGGESAADDPMTAVRPLWEEIERARATLADSDELERIKARIETRRLYAQEEVMGLARTLAHYEALGDYRLADSVLERLRAVTSEDVRRVAERYLQLDQGALLEYLPSDVVVPERSVAEIEAALRRVEAEERAVSPEVLPRSGETAEAKEIALPGGGRLLFKPRKDLPIVAMTVLFPGGRRHETRANSGITNLMLKTALKGTRSYTAEQIAQRIERLGSGIGISLAADYLGFGIKLRRDALEEGFALFTEVLRYPTFPEEEVEREKQSIYAEIRRQQDSSFALAGDLFNAAFFGEEHPYGLPMSGLEEAIAALTPEDLKAWHRRNVTASNLVIGLVGDMTEEEAVALWQAVFSMEEDLTPGPSPDSRFAGERGDSSFISHPSSLQGGAGGAETASSGEEAGSGQTSSLYAGEGQGKVSERITERAIEREKKQTAAALGFLGVPVGHPDRYALDVLSAVVSGMSGRFFRAVRGENALAYQVTGFHRSRRDAGNFVTYTSTEPENEARARAILLEEVETLRREPVGEEELNDAKAAILGDYVISMQTFGAQAGELAGTAVFDLPLDEPQQYLERIQTVTAEEVRAAAEKYLSTTNYWLGVVRGKSQE